RVESAKGLHRQGDEASGASFAGEVLDVEDGVLRAPFRDEGLPRFALQSVDEDAGALPDTLRGDGLADAGATAGDEDDFLCEAHGGRAAFAAFRPGYSSQTGLSDRWRSRPACRRSRGLR